MSASTDRRPSTAAAERRRYPRLSSKAIVQIRKLEADPDLQAMSGPDGLLQNISGGGVCLLLPEEPAVGESFAMKFHLPDLPSPVVSLGSVRWTEPAREGGFAVGVEFLWVGWQDPGAQEQIRTFIDERLRSGD